MNILPFLPCLSDIMSATTLRQLEIVAAGMLCASGRSTQLGISRWTEKGGSYRTVQRFFHKDIDWDKALQKFYQSHHHDPSTPNILIADETVISKSGKTTYGIDRFYSSMASRPISSVAVFTIAMANLDQREAIPISFEQVIRTDEEKAAARERTKARKVASQLAKARKKANAASDAPLNQGKAGRPKGSKNKNKAEIPLSPELLRISEQIKRVLNAKTGAKAPTHIAMDGHFGNQFACKMVRDTGLHLISKLRSDSKLFLEPTAQEKKERPRLKYGQKLDYEKLPASALVLSKEKDDVREELYELTCLHTDFSDKLRLSILVRTNLKTGKISNTNFFSTDLTLEAIYIFNCYTCRFQIEFIFRDAKQHFGLEDFMSVKEQSVTNSIGLAFFMKSLAQALLKLMRKEFPDAGILDLKSHSRGMRYVSEVMKCLQEKPEAITSEGLSARVACLGFIHNAFGSKKPVVATS